MRVSMKAIPGVDAVNVSLSKGLATVTMKPGNAATVKQMHEAIAKNGFTMKQSEVVVRGQVENDGGSFTLKVSGSQDVFRLAGRATGLSSFVGKQVEIMGTMPEAAKGKLPDSIEVKTITEVK